MEHKSTVFVIDDDDDVRKSLRWLFESVAIPVEDYASATAFLADFNSARPGCLVLDVRMPGMDGLELLKQLKDHRVLIPIIIITGHGDLSMAVKALKLGAIDFVQKPMNHQELLDLVRHALNQDQQFRQEFGNPVEYADRYARLTSKEQEVMQRLVDGQSNKAIALDLGVSVRTVESHRAHIMEKMRTRSFAELVRTAVLLHLPPHVRQG